MIPPQPPLLCRFYPCSSVSTASVLCGPLLTSSACQEPAWVAFLQLFLMAWGKALCASVAPHTYTHACTHTYVHTYTNYSTSHVLTVLVICLGFSLPQPGDKFFQVTTVSYSSVHTSINHSAETAVVNTCFLNESTEYSLIYWWLWVVAVSIAYFIGLCLKYYRFLSCSWRLGVPCLNGSLDNAYIC